MIDPLPIWAILTGRNRSLCHSTHGPYIFINEAEAHSGIGKIAETFKQATLLVTYHDSHDRVRFGDYEAEEVDDLDRPKGCITLGYLKDNERKIRADIAAGNGVKVGKKTRKKKKASTKPAPPSALDDEKSTIAILQNDCREAGIKYHHKNKAEKLRELLKAAGEPVTV